MTERQVKVIFGVLALLVAVYVGVRMAGGEEDDSGGIGLAAAVDGPPESVRIVEADGDTLRLERRRDTAWVDGFPADSARVASFFAALDTARAGELVSRNADNHADLGVTESAARRVLVGPAGDSAFTFLLGDPGRGGRFVRRPDSERVYVLEGPAATGAGRTEDGWRNSAVASLDTSRVARLDLERDTARTTLVRRDTAWRSPDGAAADESRVRTLLSELADLRGSGDLPADSLVRGADFSSPDAALRAWSSADGSGEPLLVLRLVRVEGDGGETYLLRRGDRPWVYALAGYRFDRLFPAEADLLP